MTSQVSISRRRDDGAGSAHDHGHDHPHTHGPVERASLGGPVVLDIGGDIGALLLRLDDGLEGTELPIEFEDDPLRDIHTGVWRRPLGAASVVVAVYPELLAGRYRIHPTGGQDGAEVVIVGGEVTELDLRRCAPGR